MLRKFITLEYRNKLRIIKNYYKQEHQNYKLIEELEESIIHLKKINKKKHSLLDVNKEKMLAYEEIIDVFIVALQLKKLSDMYLLFKPFLDNDFWSDRSLNFFKYKIDRQINRIKGNL